MLKTYLYIDQSANRGRGVYTRKPIAAGVVIEVAPVIVMSAADREKIDQTLLHDYIFEWGPLKDQCCMALGYVPIYNHSYQSNCEYFMDFTLEQMQVKTMREIAAGEELTINYNGDFDNETPVWFPTE